MGWPGVDVEELQDLGAYQEAKFVDRYVGPLRREQGQLMLGEEPDQELQEEPDDR